jgi:hypothetical protein
MAGSGPITGLANWLRDNGTLLNAIKDVLAIAAVPGTVVAFYIAIAQYQNSINLERAKTLIDMRQRYAALYDRVSAMASKAKQEATTAPKSAGDAASAAAILQQAPFLIFQEMETIWYVHRFGLLDEEMWKTYQRDICLIFANGDEVRKYWEISEPQFAQPFSELVDARRKSCQ